MMQRLEAMVWALDRINNSPNLLPNITLGILYPKSLTKNCFQSCHKLVEIQLQNLDNLETSASKFWLLAQNVDQSLATKSRTSFSFKILNKLRLQNLGQTSASKFQLNLKFKILNNLQLQNRDQNSGSKSLPNLSFKISIKLCQHVPQHQGCTSCG